MDTAVQLAVNTHKSLRNAERLVEKRQAELERTLYYLHLSDEQLAEYVKLTTE